MRLNLRIPRSLKVAVFIVITSSLVFYQNCSKVNFAPSELSSNSVKGAGEPDPICNPLSGEYCDGTKGLVGNLYYMTEALQGPLFNNNLRTAKLGDYYAVGTKVPNPVIMNQINITPRSWEDGFVTAAGSVVENGAGIKLFEWFALDLKGFIELPAGSYQLGQQSDDGMRVEVDGVEVILDDGEHAPQWKCSNVLISGGTKHAIRIGYFQGPRTMISMNLKIRSASQSSRLCDDSGGWQEIPASSFTH